MSNNFYFSYISETNYADDYRRIQESSIVSNTSSLEFCIAFQMRFFSDMR